MAAQHDYNAGDIRVLEGLDAVRLRPGMYIGTTGVKGLHHILWEIVDNSMDELANGYGSTIWVTLHVDGSASVEDDGRGIPVDLHPQLGVSGVEWSLRSCMRRASSITKTTRTRAVCTVWARR